MTDDFFDLTEDELAILRRRRDELKSRLEALEQMIAEGEAALGRRRAEEGVPGDDPDQNEQTTI